MADTLRTRLIRLAHSRPDLRPHLLPLLSKEACGGGGEDEESDMMGCGETNVMARHEKGKSVDPTKHMSPEDAEEWRKQNAIHRDKFKTANQDTGLATRLAATQSGSRTR